MWMDFNLVDDGWLPVVLTDGGQEERSLRDVLVRAHEVRALALDSPSQIPPVVRLLLAVLHQAFEGPADSGSWLKMWRRQEFDASLVTRYVDKHRGRFALFDADAPFLQVGGLTAMSGETKTVALLVPHVAAGNNVPLFSADRDARPRALSAAEAARWLVHAHAFDTAAIKTGAVGDPEANRPKTKGKTTSNPTGPLGQLGVVMPMGPTLWHTLMCNLLPRPRPSDAEDLPMWEREPLTPKWSIRAPTGPLDLFTWPSRRIRLIPERGTNGTLVVRRVVVCAGDRVDMATGQAMALWRESEPHSAWKRSSNLEKKRAFSPVYWPVQHRVEQQAWRGLGPLLAHANASLESGDGTSGGEADERFRPQALTLDKVRANALAGMPLRLLLVGVVYGNQQAVIEEVYSDVLPMPVAVLSTDKIWSDAVLEAVTATGRAVWALGSLAVNIALAAGTSNTDKNPLLPGYRNGAQEQAYAELDAAFRRWLASLGDTDDPQAAQGAWTLELLSTLRTLAHDLATAAPPAAHQGREVGDDYLNVAIATNRFRRAIKEAVFFIAPDDPDDLQPADEEPENSS